MPHVLIVWKLDILGLVSFLKVRTMTSQRESGSLSISSERSFYIEGELCYLIFIVDKCYIGIPVLFFREYNFVPNAVGKVQ